MALAMHESMYENQAVLRNMNFLKRKKVEFISPKLIEGKAKAAEPEDILEHILKKFGLSARLHNKKVLITAGPTIEYIDPIRTITNQSTGKTGILLASEFISAGARVTLVYGPGSEKPPKGAKVIHVKTMKEMYNAVKKEMKKRFDVVVLSAATSDYIPINKKQSKIKSTKRFLNIKLVQAPKIINEIRKFQKDVFLVGFKAETNISKKMLEIKARKKLKESRANIIIGNDIGSKNYLQNPNNNNVLVVDSEKVVESGWKSKTIIAKFLRVEIERRLK